MNFLLVEILPLPTLRSLPLLLLQSFLHFQLQDLTLHTVLLHLLYSVHVTLLVLLMQDLHLLLLLGEEGLLLLLFDLV